MSARNSTVQLVFCFILLTQIALQGQDRHYSKAIKIYSTYSWYSNYIDNDIDPVQTEKSLNFGRIIPGFQLQNAKGHFHEFDLTLLTFEHTYDLTEGIVQGNPGIIEGETRDKYNLAMTYGYHFNLAQKSNRIHPYIGASATPSFYMEVVRPMISYEYDQRIFSTNIFLYLIPRVIIDMSDKIFLDINIPFSPGNLYYSRVRTDNPNLRLEDRVTSSVGFFNDNIFNTFNVLIGLGFTLEDRSDK